MTGQHVVTVALPAIAPHAIADAAVAATAPPVAVTPSPTAVHPGAVVTPPDVVGHGAAPVPGEIEPAALATRCPDGMAPIPIGGCIDKYEAAASKGQVGRKPDGSDLTLSAVSGPGKAPLVNITAMQAKKACANGGKHLCTEPEWRSSCKGRVWWDRNDTLAYPYSSLTAEKRGYQPGICNDSFASDRGQHGLALTGSFPKCVTPTDVYDLSGNAAEIVDHKEPSGAWSTFGGDITLVNIDVGCDEDDTTVPATGTGATIGFRCCARGEPLP